MCLLIDLQLNLSAIARKYGIGGSRGNMVVREFLEQEKIDIGKFRNNKLNKERVRRSCLKMPGITIKQRTILKTFSQAHID